MMMVSKTIILLVMFYLFDACKGSDIYISSIGTDGTSCGKSTEPCKTIEYAFYEVFQNGDRMLLEGGKTSQYIYYMERELSFSTHVINLTLTSNPLSKYKPVITGLGKSIYVFDNFRANHTALHVERIVFRNISVYSSLNKQFLTSHMELDDCVIERSSNSKNMIYVTQTIPIDTTEIAINPGFHVNIKRCDVTQGIFCVTKVPINADIQDSKFNSHTIYLMTTGAKRSTSVLKFNNVFLQSQQIVFLRYFQQVRFSNTTFVDGVYTSNPLIIADVQTAALDEIKFHNLTANGSNLYFLQIHRCKADIINLTIERSKSLNNLLRYTAMAAFYSTISVNHVKAIRNKNMHPSLIFRNCSSEVNNVLFQDNFNTTAMNMIYSSQILTNVAFRDTVLLGAGVFDVFFISSSHISIKNIHITNITIRAHADSSLIYAVNSAMVAETVIVTQNKAKCYGIYSFQADVVMSTLIFKENDLFAFVISYSSTRLAIANLSSSGNTVQTLIETSNCNTVFLKQIIIQKDLQLKIVNVISALSMVLLDAWIEQTDAQALVVIDKSKATITELTFLNGSSAAGIVLLHSEARLHKINFSNIIGDINGIDCLESSVSLTSSSFQHLKGLLLQFQLRDHQRSGFIRLQNVNISAIINTGLLLRVAVTALNTVLIDNVAVKTDKTIPSTPMILVQLPGYTPRLSDYLSNTLLNTSIDFRMFCPSRTNPIKVTGTNNDEYSYFCKPCYRGFYTLNAGHMAEHLYRVGYVPLQNKTTITNSKCNMCAVGGVCEDTIKSKGRFYGHTTNDTVVFTSCRNDYCCSEYGTKCTATNTCNNNRTGRLCGKCEKGFHVEMFSNKCMRMGNRKTWEFLLYFIVLGSIYATVIAHLDWIVFVIEKIQNYFTKTKNGDKSTNEIHMQQFDQSVNNADQHLQDSTEIRVEKNVNDSSTSFYGLLDVVVSFYQLKILFTIVLEPETPNPNIDDILTGIFNFHLVKVDRTLYVTKNLNDAFKFTITSTLFHFLMVLSIGVIYLAVNLVAYSAHSCMKYRPSVSEANNKKATIEFKQIPLYLSLYHRFILFLTRLTMLNYKSLALFIMTILNCKRINNEYILHIYGDVKCWAWWQLPLIVVFFLWIVPFPLCMYFNITMLKNQMIGVKRFLVLSALPIIAPLFYMWKSFKNGRSDADNKGQGILGKDILTIFEEPFRQKNNGDFIYWDCWRLFVRFTAVFISVYFVNPLHRLSIMVPVTIILLVAHLMVQPYKQPIVNGLETVCLASLNILVTLNLLRSIFFVYNIDGRSSVSLILENTKFLETILNPFTFLILYIFICLCIKLICFILKLFGKCQ